ncbi:MAG: GMC family oxidoreductase [Deltaproteobacteria bacterium]|nr:GMC family oxidoreductase [Deltaproteobacteria bacterium]
MEAFQKAYDTIIVGSGPGGATVAKELSKKGQKVLILEWGNNAPIKGTAPQAFGMVGIPGKNLLTTDLGRLNMLMRGTTTGGSSVFYCATAFDPPFEMLESHGINIRAEIDELKNEIPIDPLKNDLIGPMAERIASSALELGYDWQQLNKFIYQDKCKPNCWMCSLGCPHGAKWTARNFVEEAIEHGATLVNGAKVQSVIIDGNKAVGVKVKIKRRTYKLEAPTTILGAGGIGSAEILRNSGMKDGGYDLFVDPLIIVQGKASDVKKGKEPQMQYGWHVANEYVMTDFAMPKNPKLSIMVKIKDELGGRITDKGGCKKRLSENDNKKLEKGYDHAKKILKNAGVKKINKSIVFAAHPGGSVKVGDFLDSDLKAKLDNLYVCDCSVVPEAWGLPPTLTILGLGIRLARHLLKVETPSQEKLQSAPN